MKKSDISSFFPPELKDALKNNFISFFEYSREDFAILQNRLYTLHTPNGKTMNNPENYLYCVDTKYPLEEADDIKIFEKMHLTKIGGLIDSAIISMTDNKYINPLIDKRNQADRINKNISESIKKLPVDRFIFNVIDQYKQLAGDEISENSLNECKPKTIEFELPEIRYPSIDDITSGWQVDNQISGMVCIAGLVYRITRNPSDEKIRFQGNEFGLEYHMPLTDFSKKYSESIEARIEKIINSGTQIYQKALSNIAEYISSAKNHVADQPDYSIDNGRIDVSRMPNGKYRFSVVIDPFVIKKNNNYYAFERVKVGSDVVIEGDRFRISNHPCVLDTYRYDHPFVFSGLTICFNGDKRWQNFNVHLNQDYSINNVNDARKLAYVMLQGKNNLTLGYNFDDVNPVKAISGFTPIQGGRAAAQKLGKIYDNEV